MIHIQTGFLKKAIYRYRWPIGGILLILLVLCQLHGSSIGIYAYLLNEPDLDPALWGYGHRFQLDEWAVFTPLAFSQYFDGGSGAFSYISAIPRAAATDVSLVYGQPCWNLVTFFRPFLWGYLFMQPGYGLSFFWMGRLVVLFLVSFEFALLFTRGKRSLSVCYAMLVAFSPVVQWWFSVNSFVEILIWGQGGIWLINQYLSMPSLRQRFVCVVLLAYCVVAYTLAMYPAWQVSFGYVFLLLAVWLIYTKRRAACLGKKDAMLGLVLILAAALPLAYIIHQSWPTIQAFMATEYPGQRHGQGGSFDWRWLFSYPLLYVIPYGIPMNGTPTGLGTFISFAPLGIVLALWQYVKQGIKDHLVWSLVILDVLLACFFVFPWPELLAKVTLLSYVPQGRLIPVMQFIQLVILFRVLAADVPVLNRKLTGLVSLAYLLLIGYIAWIVLDDSKRVLGMVTILAFSACACLYLLRQRRGLTMYIFLVAVISGMLANPLARGVQSVYGTELARQVQGVVAQDHTGKWLVEGEDTWGSDHIYYMNSYPIMFGAPTINSVNMYPYWPRWEALGINAAQRSVLNRYAHMNVTISNDEPTDFLNPKGRDVISDLVDVRVHTHDLKKIDVSYILTKKDLSAYSDETVTFILFGNADGYNVYRVLYHYS